MASQQPNAPEGGDQSPDLPDWADRRPDISERRAQPDSAGPGYQQAKRPDRGFLRIYLGAAAGVGKTFAMLGEGHRRAERGADVVVAFAETHGRPHTAALLDGLEVDPAEADGLPRGDVRGDGPRRRAGPQPADRPGRRARAHQRARIAEREALAGRRGTARRRHRRDLHRQRPAPRVPQRRGGEGHRRAAAGDASRTPWCAPPTRSSWST